MQSLGSEGAQVISLKIYPDPGHGWDRLEPPVVVNDPYSHLGRGAEVRVAPNEAVAKLSPASIGAFFRCKFDLGDVSLDTQQPCRA